MALLPAWGDKVALGGTVPPIFRLDNLDVVERYGRYVGDKFGYANVFWMLGGHGGGCDQPVWEWVAEDFALHPPRPTLDLEPNYEDFPVNAWPQWDPAIGWFRDHDAAKGYAAPGLGCCA